MRELALALTCIALAPAPAHAQRWTLHQRLVGVVGPEGAEHMLALGVRAPLGDGDDLLFRDAHVEAGVIGYASPIDAIAGAYLQVSPIAFLVLRAELGTHAMWPLGMDGAGFFPANGYDAELALGADDARPATGSRLQLGAILQGAIDLGPIRPILWAQIAAEHEILGADAFYYSARYDFVLQREDWMIASTSMAMIEVAPEDALRVRLGAYDDLRWVPRSDALSNVAGAIAMLSIAPVDATVSEILVLARAGVYTEHRSRQGSWTALAGLIVRYDLGAL